MVDRTPRQRLHELLQQPRSFEELRALLQVPRRRLEHELRHVARSARAHGERLEVTPARCEACAFVFRDRGERHLGRPGRCPRCRSERITDPVLQLVGAGG